MAWGDAWGYKPCKNAVKVAAAFFDGVSAKAKPAESNGFGYLLFGTLIAQRNPKWTEAEAVAAMLLDGRRIAPALEFRAFKDFSKAHVRHFAALGVDFTPATETDPPLFNGRAVGDGEWYSLKELAGMPAYVAPPVIAKRTRTQFVNLTAPPVIAKRTRTQFVNLTAPLFA